ncbi:ThiF family adenylyltransferase [Sphingomonas koreensis]|nr:ThiF family adenylyltransferase [Sphingomonas koreensis]
MECDFALPELVNLNPFLKDLDETGYLIDFVGGYLVLYGWPYLDADGLLQHGDWLSSVNLADGVMEPQDHQALWRGSRPCDPDGKPLALGGGESVVTITEGFDTNQSFSCKLMGDTGQLRAYASFAEKIETYLDKITAPAIAAFPDATPLAAIAVRAAEQASPLKFPDTMSARYEINDLSTRLRGKKCAIIGLGGTGAYILDFIARTHLATIRLFDDDKVHLHTIFRMPGFIPGAIRHRKVDVLAKQYSQWHGAIEPVPERVTLDNIAQLKDFDFVFVSVDDGPSRLLIVDWLSANGIPFVDCGMGLTRSAVGLSAIVRVTGTDRRAFKDNVGSVRLPTENPKADEYRKRPQITELNALNAAWAVIRFKQQFGLLDYEGAGSAYIFDAVTFEID